MTRPALSKRQWAQLTGGSILLMAITGGFALGYAFPLFFTPDAHQLLLSNLGLYQWMIMGILVTLVLDVIVSYGIFAYFKEDHQTLALASGILRLVYTLIFGFATFYLIQNLVINEPSPSIIYHHLQQFQTIWFGGLILFGIHLTLTGLLMKRHRSIPNILSYIAIIAGLAYIMIHLSQLMALDTSLVNVLETVLTLPMIFGELGLAFWLLIKGGLK